MKDIKKIMERDSAKKIIDEIKLKICGLDLEKICSDEEVIEEIKKSPFEQKIQRSLENAVMCGLVRFDEQKNCLVQELIHPLKSGEMECDTLYYSNKLNLGHAKGQRANDSTEALIIILNLITGKPKPLICQLQMQDITIAEACINFFDM